MLGNFPIWDYSMKEAVHFILTIPNGCLFGEGRSVMTAYHGTVVVCIPPGL